MGTEELAGRRRGGGLAAAVPPAGQHLAAVCLHQPALGALGLARFTDCSRVQQCDSPGEVYHLGASRSIINDVDVLQYMNVIINSLG